jgi:TRAP-type C4-dicarboxylate transport system substrate-binding protein
MSHLFFHVWKRFAGFRGGFAVALGVAFVLSVQAVQAGDTLDIRLGTILPPGTAQHQILQEYGEKIRKASNGRVKVTIFPNGRLGGETDMVRKMRVGQLNAGLFSVVGLAEIDSVVSGLQYMPMAFQSWEEVDFVRDRMSARLEKGIEEKGYVVLFWADMGWVRFFSKEERVTPEDFKDAKLFAWAGDGKGVEIMKQLGYNPVALETTDILTGLNTRMIDAVPTPPLLALAGQFNGPAPHMVDVKWVPIVGAAVLKKDFWNKLSPDLQKTLRELGDETGKKIRAKGRQEDLECIKTMQGRGLKVHAVSPEVTAEWRRLVEKAYPKIRGSLVPNDIFDEVQAHLKEFRNSNGKPQS